MGVAPCVTGDLRQWSCNNAVATCGRLGLTALVISMDLHPVIVCCILHVTMPELLKPTWTGSGPRSWAQWQGGDFVFTCVSLFGGTIGELDSRRVESARKDATSPH